MQVTDDLSTQTEMFLTYQQRFWVADIELSYNLHDLGQRKIFRLNEQVQYGWYLDGVCDFFGSFTNLIGVYVQTLGVQHFRSFGIWNRRFVKGNQMGEWLGEKGKWKWRGRARGGQVVVESRFRFNLLFFWYEVGAATLQRRKLKSTHCNDSIYT